MKKISFSFEKILSRQFWHFFTNPILTAHDNIFKFAQAISHGVIPCGI